MSQIEPPRRPFLSAATIVLRAPTQAWSSETGEIGESPIEGVYFSDTRIVSRLEVRFDGRAGERIATVARGADTAEFVSVLRHLDDAAPDPRVRAVHTRRATSTGVDEGLTISSGLPRSIETEIVIAIAADLAGMDAVKSGVQAKPVDLEIRDDGVRWGHGSVTAELRTDARLRNVGTAVELVWNITVPPDGDVSVAWSIVARDESASSRPLPVPPTGWCRRRGTATTDSIAGSPAPSLISTRSG